MKDVGTGQPSSFVQDLPTNGALFRVGQLFLAGPREPFLHLLDHSQVVCVPFDASPQIKEQALELHANDQAGHAQIEVAVDLESPKDRQFTRLSFKLLEAPSKLTSM